MRRDTLGKLLLQIPFAATSVIGQYMIESSSFGQGDRCEVDSPSGRSKLAKGYLEYPRIDSASHTGTFPATVKASHNWYAC